MYEDWHELELAEADDRLHEVGLKEPPAPPSLQETVPVGGDGDEPESPTVAVKTIEVPAVPVAGLGVTPVVVGRGPWLTVSDEVPELAACVESPE